ncbi:MAG: hypothetical protein JETCAE01_35360 [Anaerolineaceae bacterium]|nr:MAG: hypothetical protein JETCAE01_35360 [Anaerolineaceae bacterium]
MFSAREASALVRVPLRFGVGEAAHVVGKNLTLMGLSNRHVRLALSRGERVLG